MSGCYGNSVEDRYWEAQLDNYLINNQNGFTGEFKEYDLEIRLDNGNYLYVEISGKIEEDYITELNYNEGVIVSSNDQISVSKDEIDARYDVDAYADSIVDAIVESTIA